VVEVAYFREPVDGQAAAGVREAPLPLLVVLWLLVFANFWFGIDPSLPISLAEQEAAGFFGGAR
jgi:multicomponent Na+:H+ antiporter subunit D